MSDWKYMRLKVCVACGKKINLEEKMVLIHKDELSECWVHDGHCLESYKQLLTDPRAIKQGMILGMCYICCKPVRKKQRYLVSRIGNRGNGWGCGKEKDPFLTTLPSSENKHSIMFVHEGCEKLAG